MVSPNRSWRYWTYIAFLGRDVFRTLGLSTEYALRAVSSNKLDGIKTFAFRRHENGWIDSSTLTPLGYHSWRLIHWPILMQMLRNGKNKKKVLVETSTFARFLKRKPKIKYILNFECGKQEMRGNIYTKCLRKEKREVVKKKFCGIKLNKAKRLKKTFYHNFVHV